MADLRGMLPGCCRAGQRLPVWLLPVQREGGCGPGGLAGGEGVQQLQAGAAEGGRGSGRSWQPQCLQCMMIGVTITGLWTASLIRTNYAADAS